MKLFLIASSTFLMGLYCSCFAFTWTQQNSGTTSNLNGVDFVNEQKGYAVGVGGVIKKTTDGTTWSNITSGTTSNLISVSAVNDSVWVCGAGGLIRRSTNGGSNWTAQTSNTTNILNQIFFRDRNYGWTVGVGGVVRRTTNAGSNWLTCTSNTTKGLYDIFFVNTTTGWAVGDTGTIIRSTDGGANWSSQNSGTVNLRGVFFTDANNGRVVGHSGVYLYTTDGGTTWNTGTSGTTSNLSKLSFPSSLMGCAVGSSGTIRRTTNGGTDWFADTSGISNGLNDVDFASSYYGWAIGDGGKILSYSPTITVLSPNGGETICANDSLNVQWSSEVISEDVKIELNRSYPGTTWETIIASTPNTGLYQWKVTYPTTSSARIRITGAVHTTVRDTSNADFTISFCSDLLAIPNGGEVWGIGQTRCICWTSGNLTGNANVELNRDFPSGSWETVGSCPIADQTYTWVVSGPVSTQARIRLSAVSFPSITDTSDMDFQISNLTNWITFASDITIASGNTSYENFDVAVSGCIATITGPHSFNSMTVVNGGTITHEIGNTSGLQLNIRNDLVVGKDSYINADYCGYGAESGPGSGGGSCHTCTEWWEDPPQCMNGYLTSSGGGYGGRGQATSGDDGCYFIGGNTYGSSQAPTELGSGGGDFGGGYGGGRIQLNIGKILFNGGAVTANGEVGWPYWDMREVYPGGGSGGSIYLISGSVYGSGLISANGGYGTRGSGGGGRIAIYACSTSVPTDSIQVNSYNEQGTRYFASVTTPDCNSNGLADRCDILFGSSLDCNNNGIPDECETPPIPEHLIIRADSAHIYLNWDPAGEGVQYHVYRDSSSTGLFEFLLGTVSDTAFIDTNAVNSPSTKTFYIVKTYRP